MKLKQFLTLLTGVILSATGAMSKVAQAQFAGTPQMQPGANQTTTHRIVVRNVPASFMAWWLDPSNHPQPIQIQNARENAKMFPDVAAPTGLPLGVKVPALPAGVERIVAVDPQAALLIFSTEAGFQELKKTVQSLDRPLRQVEVEARYVEIAETDVAALPIKFGEVQAGQPEIGTARADINAAMTTLIAQGKAKIITAPRVTAINGLMANLYSTNSTPVVIAYKDENGKLSELFNPLQEKQATLFFSTSIGVSALPTLNADETMTLRIAPGNPAQLTAKNQKQLLDLNGPTPLRTLLNMRDGEVRVFKGLDSRIFGWRFDKTQPKNIIVLVTARIIRRAEDDDVKTVALQR